MSQPVVYDFFSFFPVFPPQPTLFRYTYLRFCIYYIRFFIVFLRVSFVKVFSIHLFLATLMFLFFFFNDIVCFLFILIRFLSFSFRRNFWLYSCVARFVSHFEFLLFHFRILLWFYLLWNTDNYQICIFC